QPIEIFPNPCHLLLNIKTKYDMQFPYCVCIRDLEGKIVYFNSQNVSQISLRDLKKGVYVLELLTLNITIKKLLLKNTNKKCKSMALRCCKRGYKPIKQIS
ncbi:MAG: T9SS C-terminal target domain-containing protein, partial [Sphingobacteriia bacterium]|nr:T9SS C-terminal target domain-containing protein [Sphingobacteriia bacterium]